MNRRSLVSLLTLARTAMTLSLPPVTARADASHPQLASYYARHAALIGGTVLGWDDAGAPRVVRSGIVQVAVSQTAWYGITVDADLQRWTEAADAGVTLRRGVARVAAGASGWIAIDSDGSAWQAGTDDRAQRIVLSGDSPVVDACVGDSADYLVTQDGRVHVRGLAHRGQYGDGLLRATPGYVATAGDALAVRAHTGHGLHLRRDGTVMGTGGNRFGPLSSHGLGDKADRWGAIFDGALAIATGSKHSLALRADGSLWAWGDGFAIAPARIMGGVVAVAGGDTATIAMDTAGALWQWDAGRGPRRLAVPRSAAR